MEVKVFVHKSVTEAEQKVNEWLKENNVSIKHVGQSQSEQGGKFVFTISVFYNHTQTEEPKFS